ncbi:MAG: hypothetical protein WAL38_29285 [Solirubrobacteraceae bacterium]
MWPDSYAPVVGSDRHGPGGRPHGSLWVGFHAAIATYGPIPSDPPSPLVSFNATTNPFPFSVKAAAQLLSSHGWEVVPGGTSTCQHPGTGPAECGAGITAGEGISFNLDYQAGVATVEGEMGDLAAQARQVGINLQLISHPFDTVISTATACQPTQPTCNWTAENWGAGWIYGPDFLPTGETLYYPGAVANYGRYDDPQANKLVAAAITAPPSQFQQAMTAYATYIEDQAPVVWGPTSIGTYQGGAGTLVARNLGGYAANALGYMNPEDLSFTR